MFGAEAPPNPPLLRGRGTPNHVVVSVMKMCGFRVRHLAASLNQISSNVFFPTHACFRGVVMADEVDVAAITADLYKILKPLEAADRKKVVRAALTLLDDNVDVSPHTRSSTSTPIHADDAADGFSSKVKIWMQKNGVTAEHISNVFHIDNNVAEVVAGHAPGKNAKEKTINAYVLTGLTQFLTSGEPKFEDDAARTICKSLGCYDNTNHATYLKGKGNVLGGSKAVGWTLTAPGLVQAAVMLKEMAPT